MKDCLDKNFLLSLLICVVTAVAVVNSIGYWAYRCAEFHQAEPARRASAVERSVEIIRS